MKASLSTYAPSEEVQSLDSVRLQQAKAQLQRPSSSYIVDHSRLDRLSSIAESALLVAHGSQKAAALEIGCDQSQMKRQLRLGTFDLRQASAAGPVFLAKLGEALIDEFGSVRKSKQQIALERLPELLGLMLDAIGVEK